MGLVTVPELGELVVLPFHPEAPFSEVLEWKTDVINSHNGTESRYRTRNAPRQAFSMRCPIPPEFNARAVNTAYGARARRSWGIPVWTEAQPVGSVSFGATSISLDTTNRDFRPDSLALLWSSPGTWRVVRIDEVTASSITLKEEVGLTLHGAHAMPLRVGRLRSNISRATNGYRTALSFTQEVEDNIVLASDAPTQYEGHDIYFDENLFDGDGHTQEITSRVDVIDYETGKVQQFAPWTFNRQAYPYRKVLDGLAEVLAFKKWLHRRAGKLRPFWLPTFENNVRLSMTGMVEASIIFHNDAYLPLGNDHTHIAIETKSGQWYARTITETSGTGNFRTAQLDSAVNVLASDIRRVSFLGLHRLDTDRVELSWQGGGVCVSEFRIIEVQP